MTTGKQRCYSIAEYLAFERASELKHEYHQGEIRVMPPANRWHNLLVSSLTKLLGTHLQFGSCVVLVSRMRIKVQSTGLYTYPDALVVCSKPDLEDEFQDTLLNPKLIVEVLSDSTEAYDRGRKFSHYRTIHTLEEYVLVSQNEYRVEVFTRRDGEWVFSDAHGRDSSILLRSIDCRLSLHDIYQRVEIPESSQDKPHE